MDTRPAALLTILTIGVWLGAMLAVVLLRLSA